MASTSRQLSILVPLAVLIGAGAYLARKAPSAAPPPMTVGEVTVHAGVHDISPTLAAMALEDQRDPDKTRGTGNDEHLLNALAPPDDDADADADADAEPPLQGRGNAAPIPIVSPRGADRIEQTKVGTKPAARLVSVIEGAGSGFVGPQGSNNRSGLDYALAVGPNHVFAIANGGGIHIWTKRGLPDPKTKKPMFDSTGVPLYGPGSVRTIWKGFGGQCDTRSSGDAVVRYDQLADRWLVVAPIFSRYPHIDGQQPYPEIGVPTVNWKGQRGTTWRSSETRSPGYGGEWCSRPRRAAGCGRHDRSGRTRRTRGRPWCSRRHDWTSRWTWRSGRHNRPRTCGRRWRSATLSGWYATAARHYRRHLRHVLRGEHHLRSARQLLSL